MRSKLLFFILILVGFLLLPIGIKSRSKEEKPPRGKLLESLEPERARDELKGKSIDSDELNRELT